MPVTYDLIASNTIATATSSITLSNIPGTYTDLRLIASLNRDTGTGALDVWLRFNGSTTGYSRHRLAGVTTFVNGYIAGGEDRAYFDYACAGVNPGTAVIEILNYYNTTNMKSYLAKSANTDLAISHVHGLWTGTAAITSIDVQAVSNFKAGGTVKLYGIKAA